MFEFKKLESVCEIINQKPSQFDGYKQYIATGDLQNSSIISSNDVTYEGRPSRADSIVNSGDVIFAKMANTEKTLLINNTHEEMLFSTGFAVLRPVTEVLDSGYLYHILRSDRFLSEKDRLSSGATQKAITNRKLMKMRIPVPQLSEQRRIASILNKSDDLGLYSDKCEFMRKLLIRSKFADMFEKDIESENHLPLDQICKIVDCPHSTPQYSNEPTGYYCVRSQDLTSNGELIFEKMMYVAKTTFDDRISRHRPKGGDVLFLREGSIGRSAIIPADVKICLGQRIMILSPNHEVINSTFLHHMILSDRFQHSLNRFKMGTTAGRVNIKDLRGMLMPIPDMSKQTEFQKFVDILDSVPNTKRLYSTMYESISQELLI